VSHRAEHRNYRTGSLCKDKVTGYWITRRSAQCFCVSFCIYFIRKSIRWAGHVAHRAKREEI